MFIFLDESGNLTNNDTKYFIVGSYSVQYPQKLSNAFRKWQAGKFPRKMNVQPEVKFNDSHIDDTLRRKTLMFLSQQDIRIFYSYLKVKNIPKDYKGKQGAVKTGALYTEIVGQTLELYLPITDPELRIFRDQRILKNVSLTTFNNQLTTHLLPRMPAKTLMQIQANDSTTNSLIQLIQIADWVCGALARYYEQKSCGEEFYNLLKSNIVAEKELFSDYWPKRWFN